jgi:hypothetical protein
MEMRVGEIAFCSFEQSRDWNGAADVVRKPLLRLRGYDPDTQAAIRARVKAHEEGLVERLEAGWKGGEAIGGTVIRCREKVEGLFWFQKEERRWIGTGLFGDGDVETADMAWQLFVKEYVPFASRCLGRFYDPLIFEMDM